MADLFARKIEAFKALTEEDKRLLAELTQDTRIIASRSDIVREGERPTENFIMVHGLSCRYNLLPNGSRCISSYLIPGDLCDLHGDLIKVMDHGISTLSLCTVAVIPHQRMFELRERPNLANAIQLLALADRAILRKSVVNVGGRSAEQRVGHFLCELLIRLDFVGLVTDGAFELPLTQTDLADSMGVSDVHMNRVLQRLRRLNLLSFRLGKVVIRDTEGLKKLSGFNPNYLHLEDVRAA